jgi:DNA mismatch repair protein MutL
MEAWRTGRRVSQQLLIPIEIGLSARHAALVERHIGTLGGMGIDLEPFGVNSFIVRGLPEAVAGSDPKVVVTDIVEELESVGGETSLTALVADIASRVACHAVVRGAKTLGEHEAAALARRLDGVDFGVACPHGRPVYFEIGRPEIEKRFSRR